MVGLVQRRLGEETGSIEVFLKFWPPKKNLKSSFPLQFKARQVFLS